MFETNTYDTIMDRMLEYVPSTLNKDEGSFIYTALGPVAIEHHLFYTDMDTYYTETFASTCSREALILKAAEVGLTPHEASAAVWAVEVEPEGRTIADGTRFNCDAVNLYVSGKTEDGYYEMTCEELGTVGNNLKDDLIPITYISGFESATLVELLTAGVDEEETEDFRDRYLTYLQTPAASGNAYDYYNWAMEVDGVGAAKVYPLADGAGTVTVVITDSDKKAATDALIAEVYEYIEELRPIGATVTVTSGSEVTCDVAATLVIEDGYTLSEVLEAFEEAFTEYLEDGAFEASYVSIAYVGHLLIETDGVEDYSDLTLNQSTGNFLLEDTEIAVVGSITLEVEG